MKKLLIIILVLPLCKLSAQIPFNFDVPDVMIESSTNIPNTEFLNLGESSIYINPTNPKYLINANNANFRPPPLFIETRGIAIFSSDDAGQTWYPNSNAPGFFYNSQINDPSVAIDHNNRK